MLVSCPELHRGSVILVAFSALSVLLSQSHLHEGSLGGGDDSGTYTFWTFSFLAYVKEANTSLHTSKSPHFSSLCRLSSYRRNLEGCFFLASNMNCNTNKVGFPALHLPSPSLSCGCIGKLNQLIRFIFSI